MSECTNDIYMPKSANKFKMEKKTEITLCGTPAKLESVPTNSVKIDRNVIIFSQKKKQLWEFFLV